jgi:hypothetical protein
MGFPTTGKCEKLPCFFIWMLVRSIIESTSSVVLAPFTDDESVVLDSYWSPAALELFDCIVELNLWERWNSSAACVTTFEIL